MRLTPTRAPEHFRNRFRLAAPARRGYTLGMFLRGFHRFSAAAVALLAAVCARGDDAAIFLGKK